MPARRSVTKVPSPAAAGVLTPPQSTTNGPRPTGTLTGRGVHATDEAVVSPYAEPTYTSKGDSQAWYCALSARLKTATYRIGVRAATRTESQAFGSWELATSELRSPSTAFEGGKSPPASPLSAWVLIAAPSAGTATSDSSGGTGGGGGVGGRGGSGGGERGGDGCGESGGGADGGTARPPEHGT